MTTPTGAAGERIAQGDACSERSDAPGALAHYLAAEKLGPGNAALLARISREYRHAMSGTPDAQEKRRLGRLAVEHADRAVAVDAADPDAWLAVALGRGKLQPWEDARQKLESARVVKQAVDAVLRLDPGRDLAWHVLGRWHVGFAELTGVRRSLAEMAYGKLPVATFEEAARCFERAAALRPDRLAHVVELGQAYLRLGRTEEARRLLSRGLAMPETERDDREAKQTAREELANIR